MNEILLEASNDCLWALDVNYRHTYTNGALERVLGYTREELNTETVALLLHEGDRERAAALLARAARTRKGWTGQVFRFRAKDGATRWLESNGSPIFDDQGRLTGFAGADRDVTQRIEQEQRLAQTERRFRAMFQYAGVGMARIGLETGRWLEVNQTLSDILGYSPQELLERTFQELTHPDDLPADLAEAERLQAGKIASYTTEKRYLRKDGASVWTSLTASIVRDEGGVPEYGVAVVKDISERKAAEAALRQSEHDWRTIFESSHDPILIIDPHSAIVLAANRKASAVYGYTIDELVGMSMEQISADEPRGRGHIPELLSGAAEVRFETVHRHRDGHGIELELTAAIVQYGGRKAVLTTNRDVTERNRLVRALAASERRFRAIIEHGYDVMIILDERGGIRFASGTVAQELGYTPEELTGTSILEKIAGEDRERVQAVFAAVHRSPDARDTITCRVRNKRGDWRSCEGTIVNMTEVDGVGGVVVTVRDITERVALEGQLEQTRRVESLGRVAATVAHEFNNSLMAIQPVADVLMRKHGSNPDIARLAQQLVNGVQRGRRVAGGILRFANPSEPARKRIELQPWLTALAAELRPVIGAQVELTTQIETTLAVDADPEQLHQLIMNLVLNARDAMPGGGTISIVAGRAGASVDIAVGDTGPGVPPEIRARLFEPLFTTKRNGTGLGLPVCQQIVTVHGGALLVEDGPGSGAVFRARFPAAVEVPRDAQRVLLVEDDPAIADSLMLALEDLYDVTWTADGRGVVERVRELRPHLVLLDVQLPDADGREIHAELRRQSLAVPVVLMSGSATVAASELDARTAFLAKPFDVEHLLAVAAKIAY